MINPPMTCNAAGLQIIQNHEKCKLVAYWDDKGKCWTIGWGHTGLDVSDGLVWTQEQADDALRNDLQTAERCINRLVTVSLSSNQFSALCSLVFNIGVGNFETSGTLQTINAGLYDQVPTHIKGWNKSKGVVLAELIRRRADEVALWNTPDGGNDADQNA